jgi:imidazolonepropionase-like amidohydrolase
MLGIRAERLFDGERLRTEGALVLVDRGRIAGVEPLGTSLPAGWSELRRPGTTLLPGLVNTHVHLCGDGGPGALERLPDYDDAALGAVVERALRQQLASGVTTVRDLGDRSWAVAGRPNRRGDELPAVVAAGPPVTVPGGHCWNMGGAVSGPDQIVAAVRERGHRGADVVKVMVSGGAMTPGTDALTCQFTLEELLLLVGEAHRRGLPVTAHAHGLPAVELAIEAGVDGIEHCTCLTPSGIAMPDALAETLAAREIAVCPTLGTLPGAQLPPSVLAVMERTGMTSEDRLDQVRRMYQAGVRLVSGGDDGINPARPHGVLPYALAEMAEAGVPAEYVLASATAHAADACGLGARKGRIRPGYDADLLLVAGDPTTDITALRSPLEVFLAGTSRHRRDTHPS